MKRFDFSKKYNICFVCFCIIMLITSILCFSFPVVHAESTSDKIGDHFFMKDFLTNDGFLSHNGETGYYTINQENIEVFLNDDNNGMKHLFIANVNDTTQRYYYEVKKIFDLEYVPKPGTSVVPVYNNFTIFTIPSDPDAYYIGFDMTRLMVGFGGPTSGRSYYTSNFDKLNRVSFSGNDLNNVSIEYVDYHDLPLFDTFTIYENIIASSCPIYMDRPSYGNVNINYTLIDDNVGVGDGGFQVPGGNVDPANSDILNKEFIYDSSCMFVSGKSISDCGLNIALDFPSGAVLSDFSYKLNITLNSTYTFNEGLLSNNPTWLQMLNSYGTNNISIGEPWGNSLTFSGNLESGLSHNCFTIPCNQFNGAITSAYTAYNPKTHVSNDYNVNAVNLATALSFCPTSGTLNQANVVTSNNSGSGNFSLGIPIYKSMTSGDFNPTTFLYTFNLDLYKGDTKITSVPLGCTYNALSGESVQTTNPGYDKTTVTQTIDDYNGDNDPSDPNYKDPNDYQQTIDVQPNSGGNSNSSSNSQANGGNNSVNVVVNNNPTFNNDNNSSSSSSSIGDGIIIPTLIKWIAGGKSSSVDEIESISGVNGWLTVIQGTYSFIPSTVWSALSTCFIACIGILVVAFIISIVIKLIT